MDARSAITLIIVHSILITCMIIYILYDILSDRPPGEEGFEDQSQRRDLANDTEDSESSEEPVCVCVKDRKREIGGGGGRATGSCG
jgi:hypothetical protein